MKPTRLYFLLLCTCLSAGLHARLAVAETIVLMEASSLQVSRHEAGILGLKLKEAIETAVGDTVLEPDEIARRARSHKETRALLDMAEAAFQRGRTLHVELDIPGAIAAYRDAIASYQRAATSVYLQDSLAEAHLQLACALSESNRLGDSLQELKAAVLLAPWRKLDPSVYNPSIRKLHDRKRDETEKLPDMPADSATLGALGRMSQANLLVRPLVESSQGGLVMRAVVIDLEKGKMTGVESVLLGRDLQSTHSRIEALAGKLLPAMGRSLSITKPGNHHEPLVVPQPPEPIRTLRGPSLDLAAGFNAGFGNYPRLGARVLNLRFNFSLHERFALLVGVGALVGVTDQVDVDQSVPDVAGKLTLWQFPLEACVQVLLLPGDVQIYAELGAVFELVSLSASEGLFTANQTTLAFLEDHAFGYGPGGRVAVSLRFRAAESLSVLFIVGYRVGKLFYSDDILARPPPQGNPIKLQPADVLQSLTLSAGVTLDL